MAVKEYEYCTRLACAFLQDCPLMYTKSIELSGHPVDSAWRCLLRCSLVARELVPFRVRHIKKTADVSLTRFDHPAGASLPDSEEQAADRFQINIVERGAFRLGHEGREWLLDSGCVFLSRPNDVYRYAHLQDVEPDTCLSVTLSRSLSDELSENLRCLPLVPQMTNRLRFLQLELGSIIRDDIH